MIQALKSFIEREFQADFKLVEEYPYTVSYFGYKIRFRVEIEMRDIGAITPLLSANFVPYDPQPLGAPSEIKLATCKFDRLGNVTVQSTSPNPVPTTLESFSPRFMAEVFRAAMGRGMTMRP